MADNCPHVPVDMLHGWRIFGRGRDWDVGGEAVVDHDERPRWDIRDWTGGDCEMWDTAEGGWMLAAIPTDRTGWPPDGSEWAQQRRDWVRARVEWYPQGWRWRLRELSYEGTDGEWLAEPIDLDFWRPL